MGELRAELGKVVELAIDKAGDTSPAYSECTKLELGEMGEVRMQFGKLVVLAIDEMGGISLARLLVLLMGVRMGPSKLKIGRAHCIAFFARRY